MSGLEIAGVALAILPLLKETVKGYYLLSEKFRTLRDISRKLRSIQVDFDAQQHIFLNETRILLRLAIQDEREPKCMTQNQDHHLWHDGNVEDRLRKCLDTNFEMCVRLIQGTKEVLDELGEELASFDDLRNQTPNDASLRQTFRRFRGSVTVAVEKSRYEKTLNSLRNRNNDLRALSSQCRELWKPVSTRAESKVSLPSRYVAVQTASQKCWDTLARTWCCKSNNNKRHIAQLWLDADFKDGVGLDLAVSCRDESDHDGKTPSSKNPQEAPVWLYVQTIETRGKVIHSAANLNQHFTFIQSFGKVIEDVESAHYAISATTPKPKKNQKASFFENPSDSTQESQCGLVSGIGKKPVLAISQQPTGVETSKARKILHFLNHMTLVSEPSLPERCLGYVETPNLFRHIFWESDIHQRAHVPFNFSVTMRMTDLIIKSEKDELDVADQFRLAHRASLAVLQFGATSWLSRRWTLEDFAFFKFDDHLSGDVLKTLHLNADISHNTQETNLRYTPVERSTSETGMTLWSIDDYVKNMTLFCLGVALLELAHWEPLASLKRDADANVFMTATRLANGRSPLGPRYQKIVQKCLHCNFGDCADLQKQELQSAIYGDVVCQLAKLIETIDQ